MAANSNSEFRIGIVGGSIAGCAAALEFSRAGYDVTIFERSVGELTGRGAGIGTPTSMLASLIERDLLDVDFPYFVLSDMPFTGRISATDRLGHTAWIMPINIALLNWGDLYRNLRKRVPDSCYQQGKTVTAVRMIGSNIAEILLDDGITHNFNLVIFADGYRSMGRKMLCPDVQLQYRGYVLWRGVLPESELDDCDPLETSIPRLTYKGLPGHMVLYFVPGFDGSVARGERLVNWAAYIPVSAEELPAFLIDRNGRQQSNSIPPGSMRMDEEKRLKKLMRQHLPTYYADIVNASEDTFAQPIYTAEMPGYFQDRLCLMGDAGALAQPFTGSGVFKGVNNAIDLVDLLYAYDNDVDRALREWEEEQINLGRRLVILGEQMEQAFIWNPLDFSLADEEETAAWWKASVTFPKEFTYAADKND